MTNCPPTVAAHFAAGRSITECAALTGLRRTTLQRYYRQWQRGNVTTPTTKPPRSRRTCPAHIAAYLDASPSVTAADLAAAFGVARKTAHTYISLYRHRERCSNAWHCAACGRSSRDVPRHCNASICRDCYTDLTQQDQFFCRQCHRRIGRSAQSPVDLSLCSQCAPPWERSDLPSAYALYDHLRSLGGNEYTVRDVVTMFPSFTLSAARLRVHWMIRLNLVRPIVTRPVLRFVVA